MAEREDFSTCFTAAVLYDTAAVVGLFNGSWLALVVVGLEDIEFFVGTLSFRGGSLTVGFTTLCSGCFTTEGGFMEDVPCP